MSDAQHCAFILLSLLGLVLLGAAAIEAMFDALHRAGWVIDAAQRDCTRDPIDAHYDTTIREVPISAELRADFSRWEREVAS